MPCVFQHGARIFFQSLHNPFPCGTVDHPRLTESAPADTSSLDFQHNTVLGCLDKRHYRFHRIGSIRYFQDYLFFYFLRRVRIIGGK